MSLSSFTQGYIECALWSSTNDCGDSLEGCTLWDEALCRIDRECLSFYEAHHDTWTDAGLDDKQAGHDFWLTRNRHGSGFWDRDIGIAGDILTDAAHKFGELDLYVGDDGRVYL